MSVLDRVYSTFKRLDQDYARSKKTRTEFITDKFGGDINVGSVIILDAIRAEGNEETSENIAKMSFVKDIFAKIRDNSSRLDALDSFAFAEGSIVGAFTDALLRAENHQNRQEILSQTSLWGKASRALHYHCTEQGMSFSPLDDCRVFRVYNEHIGGLMAGAFNADREMHLGEYYRVLPGRRLKIVQEAAVAKNLK